MNLYRHIPFLKEVFKYALSAFGGPQGHFGMMTKTFVEKRKDITAEELVDFMSFCQILPGPSSTQTITLIGYKRGGVLLALLTLLLWILPAAIMMTSLSFLIQYFDTKSIQTNLFKFIQPMAVGFLAYAAFKAMRISVKHQATYIIMGVALVLTILFRSPWVFPALIVLGGIVTNFSNKRIPDIVAKPKPIKWVNIWWFVIVFIVAGVLSELARVQHWQYARAFNLFENFYRFGSFVFGGGHALMPMMYEQFISRPEHLHLTPYLSPEQFLIGAGMVNAIPGPVFSICSYIGGLSMSNFGLSGQLAGSGIATIGVFLPSILLLFFFFPIYQNLKQYTVIYRALEGIHAVVVGIMWASGYILFSSIQFEWLNLVVVLITFSVLMFSKIPAPLIVLAWLLLGWAM
ncbi:MAG: chromate efflux transporter [Bacteroidetes bacterium]|nr:chromate efflux transporter [Bacteroidota bacterium]